MKRAVLVVAALLVTNVHAAPQIGTLPSSVKLMPGASYALGSSATLKAAKNEFEAFQLVVIADGAGLPSVTVTKPTLALTTNSAVTISASDIRLYRAAFITQATASNKEGGTGAFPDPLIPDSETVPALIRTVAGTTVTMTDTVTSETRGAFPVTLGANEKLLVWVDTHVPETATAGTYTGNIRVSSTGLTGGFVDVPVTLTVRMFTLPSTSSLPVYVGFSADIGCRKLVNGDSLGDTSCNSNSDRLKVNALYGRFMLQHRVSLQLQDHPLSGTTSSWQGAYGPLMTGTETDTAIQNTKQLASAKQTTVRYPFYDLRDSSTTRVQRASDWWNFIVSNGWQEQNFDYTIDEPEDDCARWSAFKARADELHNSVNAAFKTMVTTSIDKLESAEVSGCGSQTVVRENLTSKADVIVPLVNRLDAKPNSYTPNEGNQRPAYSSFLSADSNNRLWSYQSCMSHSCGAVPFTSADADQFTNWPNLMVDATGVQNRSEPWIAHLYRTPGLLYYESAKWYDYQPNPDGGVAIARDMVPYDAGFFSNTNIFSTELDGAGDGLLVYPGRPETIGGTTTVPVASYRLKMLREGLEDYEYLKQCADKDAFRARSIASDLFPMTGIASTTLLPTGSAHQSNNNGQGSNGRGPVELATKLEAARDLLADCVSRTWTKLLAATYSQGYGIAVANGTTSTEPFYVGGLTDAIGTVPPGGGGFVAKYDSDGTQTWLLSAMSKVLGLATAPSGDSNVYAAGEERRDGYKDAVVMKISSSGSVLWTTKFGGYYGQSIARAVAVDASGNVYVVGVLSSGNMFLAKVNSSGVQQWLREVGHATFNDEGFAVDLNGNVYIAGNYYNATTFYYDAHVVKFDTSGTATWSYKLGDTTGSWIAKGVKVDSSGNVFVVGDTNGYEQRSANQNTLGTGSHSNDLFVAKFSSTTTSQAGLAWVKQLGSAKNDYANGLALDSSGNVLMVGATEGLMGTFAESKDALLVTVSGSNGATLAIEQFGGLGGVDDARGIARSSNGEVYIVGETLPAGATAPRAFARKL